MSSFLIAAPHALTSASGDLTGIGEAIRAARASAASATTVMAPAATDEVSAAITRLLDDYAEDFQAISTRAASFHDRFVQTLLHSARAFAGAEAANGSSLQTLKRDLLGLIAPGPLCLARQRPREPQRVQAAGQQRSQGWSRTGSHGGREHDRRRRRLREGWPTIG